MRLSIFLTLNLSFLDISLKNLIITVINFAIKRLSNAAYRIQALETLASIFSNGNHASLTSNN